MKNVRYVSRILLGIGALLAVLGTATPIGAASTVKGAGSDSADPLIGVWQKAMCRRLMNPVVRPRSISPTCG